MTFNMHASRSTSTADGEIALPYLTFQVGTLHYALAIPVVVEVAAMVEPIPLAAAPLGVVGMANRHGEPILLVDLQTVLDAFSETTARSKTSQRTYGVNTLFIVVQPEKSSNAPRFAILVERVHQVEYFTPSACTPLPHQVRNPVQAVISVEDRMIQLLDLSQILQTTFGEDSRQNGSDSAAFSLAEITPFPAASLYDRPI
jgi:chemotaxis signal transduction protein